MTVEAALVLPLVFLFLLGIMEYARFLMFEHVFNNAVRAGPSTRPSTAIPS